MEEAVVTEEVQHSPPQPQLAGGFCRHCLHPELEAAGTVRPGGGVGLRLPRRSAPVHGGRVDRRGRISRLSQEEVMAA